MPGPSSSGLTTAETGAGRASAAFYIAFDSGIGVGSWIFGIVLQFAGVMGLYWVAAAIAAAALPLAPRVRSRT